MMKTNVQELLAQIIVQIFQTVLPVVARTLANKILVVFGKIILAQGLLVMIFV